MTRDARLFFFSMWLTIICLLFVGSMLAVDTFFAQPDRGGGHPILALTRETPQRYTLHAVGKELTMDTTPLREYEQLRRRFSAGMTPAPLRLAAIAYHWGQVGFEKGMQQLNAYFYQLEVVEGKLS